MPTKTLTAYVEAIDSSPLPSPSPTAMSFRDRPRESISRESYGQKPRESLSGESYRGKPSRGSYSRESSSIQTRRQSMHQSKRSSISNFTLTIDPAEMTTGLDPADYAPILSPAAFSPSTLTSSASRATLQWNRAILSRFLLGQNAPNVRYSLSSRSRLSRKQQLVTLSEEELVDLSQDVCDEVRRRQDEIFLSHCADEFGGFEGKGLVPRHLPPKREYEQRRNEVRRKLSTLLTKRFEELVGDVLGEIGRRMNGTVSIDEEDGRTERLSSSGSSSSRPISRGLRSSGSGSSTSNTRRLSSWMRDVSLGD